MSVVRRVTQRAAALFPTDNDRLFVEDTVKQAYTNRSSYAHGDETRTTTWSGSERSHWPSRCAGPSCRPWNRTRRHCFRGSTAPYCPRAFGGHRSSNRWRPSSTVWSFRCGRCGAGVVEPGRATSIDLLHGLPHGRFCHIDGIALARRCHAKPQCSAVGGANSEQTNFQPLSRTRHPSRNERGQHTAAAPPDFDHRLILDRSARLRAAVYAAGVAELAH